MHIHVNTASEHLRDFTERLPELFDREGEVLHAGRNTIKAFEAEGERLVVKRFKRPNLLRAVIYTFFRRSKARRSYEHAVRLRALGVDSPEPVAWSEYRRRGLLCDSYYVSRRSDYTPLSQTTARFPAAGTLPVLEAFARFLGQELAPMALLIQRLEVYAELEEQGEKRLCPLEDLAQKRLVSM